MITVSVGTSVVEITSSFEEIDCSFEPAVPGFDFSSKFSGFNNTSNVIVSMGS